MYHQLVQRHDEQLRTIRKINVKFPAHTHTPEIYLDAEGKIIPWPASSNFQSMIDQLVKKTTFKIDTQWGFVCTTEFSHFVLNEITVITIGFVVLSLFWNDNKNIMRFLEGDNQITYLNF